jgi:membrane protease YdiL (CAAX protease family)
MPFIVELAVRRENIRNLGFQRTNFKRSLPLTLGLIGVWILVFLFVPQIFGKTPLPAQSLLFAASIFFHPGLVEELSFRGFLETRLERLFTVKKALVIQAVLFGLYHLPQVFAGGGWLVIGGLFYPFFAFIFGLVLGASPIVLISSEWRIASFYLMPRS